MPNPLHERGSPNLSGLSSIKCPCPGVPGGSLGHSMCFLPSVFFNVFFILKQMLLKRINQCICFSCSRQGSLWHIIYALSVMVAKLHKGIQGVEEHVKDMAHESVCKVLEQQWSSLDTFLFFQ